MKAIVAAILSVIIMPYTGQALASCEEATAAPLMTQEHYRFIDKVPQKPNPELFASELDPFLGLSFMATSNDAKAVHQIIVETLESEALSRRLGRRIAFQTRFSVGPRETLITRAFSEFELIDLESGARVEGATLKPERVDFKLSRVGYSPQAGLRIPNNKIEMLPIYDCDDLLTTQVVAMNLATFLFFRGSKPIESYESAHVQNIARILEAGIKNLLDPAIQNSVIKIAAQGPDVIEKHLLEVGLRFGKTVYAHVPQKVWAHLMGQKELADAGQELGPYPVMVEGGDFAISHGAYAHHVQLLAFFWDMPSADRKLFLDALMQKQRSDEPQDWYSWVTLFDSDNTRSPNTAFFWHQKLLAAQFESGVQPEK